jgi:hypothetical protein
LFRIFDVDKFFGKFAFFRGDTPQVTGVLIKEVLFFGFLSKYGIIEIEFGEK